MKKIFTRLIILFLTTIYFVSLSPSLMKEIVDVRTKPNALFPSYRVDMGDLYGLSFLKKFGRSGWKPSFIPDTCTSNKNIDLYTISDSYLNNRMTKKAFCGVNNLIQVSWDGAPSTIQLDTQKTNILIIETVERYTCVRFNVIEWMKHFNVNVETQKAIEYTILSDNSSKIEEKMTLEDLSKKIFNPNINQNLEFNLFDYKPFLFVWETRAELTQKLFKRLASPIVSIAANNKYLVLKETADGKQNTASNFPIADVEADKIVENLNEVSTFYRQKGFSEVYLSIIPNPIHIVDTTFNYNQLIPKIQNHKNLKMPIIDVYPVFKENNTLVFHKNESHWTNQGMQFWIDQVNLELKKNEK
jgi:hypothetical protein